MIRFIDLKGQIYGNTNEIRSFAFYDTVTDRFCEFSGEQAWDGVEDFMDDFTDDNIERFLILIPKNFFDKISTYELRIGSYYWSGYNCKIVKLKGFIPEDSGYEIQKGIPFTGYLIEGCDKLIPWGSLGPISLTEEWLLKFGFDKRYHTDNNDCYYHPESDITLFLKSDARNVNFPYVMINRETVKIEFVHQLQNLFFELKRKELNIR